MATLLFILTFSSTFIYFSVMERRAEEAKDERRRREERQEFRNELLQIAGLKSSK